MNIRFDGSAMTTSHTISIHHVEQMLAGACRHGVDPEPVMQRAGIPVRLLKSPLSRVSQDQYARLMYLLRRDLRDEFFGLCSHPVPLGAFAHMCQDLIQCETLGDALRRGFTFYHLLLKDFVPRLVVQGETAHVCVRDQGDEPACLSYAKRMFMFFTWGVSSWLAARRIPLQQVSYQDMGDGKSNRIHLIFDAPLKANDNCFGFTFESRWLELPVVQNRLSLTSFLRQAPANLLVRYRDETSCSERIRRLLRRHLSSGLPTLEEVGSVLGMTPQTVRRRLRDEGQCYQGLKDNLRCDAAIEYLSRPDLNLVDVASKLGFSELSTFHRAFKKWTGLPPGEYRYTRLKAARPYLNMQ
ncbi:AraC family transcriptional regulator [Alloalcanivorax xenomutans]|jgi:AraC-like DNA-binding protein|uniref:AraC family transcriptional regulator n=2 Tax=Alloalcanivorax xenomutans TaxID=1094342 RepID=UPI0003B89861|nr:AraC family transcriptional regulator [Alloalcanivorax xenomutans]ERS10933.1 AraC family transcriptional regulator [Alcanivorax sp. PN-3]MBA4720168.1 AraC family transcriptional regulator [Alcanivorax sp.]WOA33373.1 AraC family transcriptional regulator [Alloalcanivorax xenomutans]CUR46934.1 Transcriptional regulator, AraC family [Alloalcanivorax xenomutans]SOB97418.1 AraC-like DNA-binding protein [Alloalcanivorax xenomutans]